jgi:hypothetical protein
LPLALARHQPWRCHEVRLPATVEPARRPRPPVVVGAGDELARRVPPAPASVSGSRHDHRSGRGMSVAASAGPGRSNRPWSSRPWSSRQTPGVATWPHPEAARRPGVVVPRRAGSRGRTSVRTRPCGPCRRPRHDETGYPRSRPLPRRVQRLRHSRFLRSPRRR